MSVFLIFKQKFQEQKFSQEKKIDPSNPAFHKTLGLQPSWIAMLRTSTQCNASIHAGWEFW